MDSPLWFTIHIHSIRALASYRLVMSAEWSVFYSSGLALCISTKRVAILNVSLEWHFHNQVYTILKVQDCQCVHA